MCGVELKLLVEIDLPLLAGGGTPEEIVLSGAAAMAFLPVPIGIERIQFWMGTLSNLLFAIVAVDIRLNDSTGNIKLFRSAIARDAARDSEILFALTLIDELYGELRAALKIMGSFLSAGERS
jgi:hypothetical protein